MKLNKPRMTISDFRNSDNDNILHHYIPQNKMIACVPKTGVRALFQRTDLKDNEFDPYSLTGYDKLILAL